MEGTTVWYYRDGWGEQQVSYAIEKSCNLYILRNVNMGQTEVVIETNTEARLHQLQMINWSGLLKVESVELE